MGRIFFKMIFIVSIAVMSGITVVKNLKEESLSDIVLANLEALASLEGDKPNIPGTSTADCNIYCQIDYRYDCFMAFLDGTELRCYGYRKK